MTKDINAWELIQRIYESKYNIPSKVIDYVAVNDILNLCAEGYKNAVIATITKQPVGYVNDVVVKFLRFYGWKDTLDISPFSWYNESNKDFEKFMVACLKESLMMTISSIHTAFQICETYDKILMEIGKYYADS